MLGFFGIQHAKVIIEDMGALEFVIAARLEAAIREIHPTEKEYLTPMLSGNSYTTDKHLFRRSRLYIPGNSPKLMINAGIHAADGIILDLEDSVAPDKKNEARHLVRNALRSVNFYGTEKMVRINQIPGGLDDLKYIVPHHVNLILIPKCESADDVKRVNEEIERFSKDRIAQIHLMPIIESALGVINAYSIASAAENVVALAIGLEDYTADLGVSRSETGMESFYARSAIVNAAVAAGIQAIDSVFSDVSDMDALKKNVTASRALGFTGMGCIHPRQVEIINTGFNPGLEEIEKAKVIVLAYDEAKQKGLGVIAVGSKMVDMPVVKRAQHTIELALKSNLLKENWRDEENE
jgi:citrate lyase subunit beta/citryl-CoA lyase